MCAKGRNAVSLKKKKKVGEDEVTDTALEI